MTRRGARRSLVLVWLGLAAAVGACAPATPNLTLSTRSIDAHGGMAPITIEAALVGATGQIDWELDPPTGAGSIAPAGALATDALAPLAVVTGGRIEYTPPSSVDVVSSATLTATLRGQPSVSAQALIELRPLPVSARVVDGGGVAVSGASVLLDGIVAATGADGTVSMSAPAEPYDIAVLSPLTGDVYAFSGVRRTDPVLMLGAEQAPFAYAAQVIGDLFGGAGHPNPADTQTLRFFGAGRRGVGIGWLDPGQGPGYVIDLDLLDAGPIDGTLCGLQLSRDAVTDRPIDYHGFGCRSATVEDGDVLTGFDVELGDVTNDDLSGTVDFPAGFGYDGIFGRTWTFFQPNAATTHRLDSDVDDTSFDFTVPAVPGGSFLVGGFADDGTGAISARWRAGIEAGTTGVDLSYPMPPLRIAPLDGATVDATTPFRFDARAGAVYELRVWPTVGSALHLLTTDQEVLLPDVGALGFDLTPSTSYGWAVDDHAPFGDMDAATGPDGYASGVNDFLDAFFWYRNGPTRDGSFTRSSEGSFVTGP